MLNNVFIASYSHQLHLHGSQEAEGHCRGKRHQLWGHFEKIGWMPDETKEFSTVIILLSCHHTIDIANLKSAFHDWARLDYSLPITVFINDLSKLSNTQYIQHKFCRRSEVANINKNPSNIVLSLKYSPSKGSSKVVLNKIHNNVPKSC